MYCVAHIALSVTNLEKSLSFYSQFGFKVVKQWSAPDGSLSIALAELKGVILELFCYKQCCKMPSSAKDISTDLPVIGTKHFALGVSSVRETFDELSAKGIIPEGQKINTGRLGKEYFFIKDPDGILVEIIAN